MDEKENQNTSDDWISRYIIPSPIEGDTRFGIRNLLLLGIG